MVESRWLRWFGPGLVALGAVGLDRIDDARRGTARRGRRAPAPGRRRERVAAARDAAPVAPADLRRRRGSASTRSLDGDGALRGQRLVARPSSATRSPGRSTCPPSRSPPARSAASSWSAPMTASSSRLEARRRRARLRLDDRDGARRHPASDDRPGRHADLRDARRSRHAGRPRRLAPPARRQPAGRAASSPPIAPDDRFGRTFSTEFAWDRGRATGSPSSRVARSPAGRASSTRTAARRSRSTTPDLGPLVGLDGDRLVTYARVPRPALPDRLDDLATGDATAASPTAAGSRPSSRRRTGPGSSTRPTRRRHRGFARSPLDGGAAADLGPLPDGLRLADDPPAGPRRRLPAGWVAPRPRRPPADRPARPPPTAPPHPGRRDRPARRGHPMTRRTTIRPSRVAPWRSSPRSRARPRVRPASPPRTARTRSCAAGRSARTRTCASAGGRAPSRPPRSRPRSRPPRPTPRDRGPRRRRPSCTTPTGANPIGYGVGATCGVNGLACFTRDAPNGFTMWLREQGHVFDWGTLKWCQTYTHARRTAATTPRRSRSTSSATSKGSATTSTTPTIRDYLDAVVQTYSRTKPSTGWNVHAFGRCDTATLQMLYDVTVDREVLDLPRPRDRPDALRASRRRSRRRARRRSPPRSRSWTTTPTSASAATRSRGRTVTLQRRAPGATTWTTVGTMRPARRPARTSCPAPGADDGIPRRLQDARRRGLNGDTSAGRQVTVAACASDRPSAAAGIAAPCI